GGGSRRSRSCRTQRPSSCAPTPISSATCAIGRSVSSTRAAASRRYSGVYLFRFAITTTLPQVSTTRHLRRQHQEGKPIGLLRRRVFPNHLASSVLSRRPRPVVRGRSTRRRRYRGSVHTGCGRGRSRPSLSPRSLKREIRKVCVWGRRSSHHSEVVPGPRGLNQEPALHENGFCVRASSPIDRE